MSKDEYLITDTPFSNSDLSISLNMNFIFLQWIQICNRILCRLIQLQSGYRLSNVERFILIQRKSLLISFIHKKNNLFNEIDKSEFEKVSEWDITIQDTKDTMEEYDNVER